MSGRDACHTATATVTRQKGTQELFNLFRPKGWAQQQDGELFKKSESNTSPQIAIKYAPTHIKYTYVCVCVCVKVFVVAVVLRKPILISLKM